MPVSDDAILIGLGSNLSSADGRSSQEICDAAIASLDATEIDVVARSRWFQSAPVPVSKQPLFINGVIRVETSLDAVQLLAVLHEIEAMFGRVRRERLEARVLDLDLLAYGRQVVGADKLVANAIRVPHPEMMSRAFVLAPLLDVEPSWCHPLTGESAIDALARVSSLQQVEPVEEV